MGIKNQVVWSEGMFLKPHHFQQQERYLEYQLSSKPSPFGNFFWGVTRLKLDQQLLKQSNISLEECEGVFPDHTFFSIPHDAPPPLPLSIAKETINEKVYLCIPMRRQGIPETRMSGDANEQQYAFRYHAELIELTDHNTHFENSTEIEISKLQTKILLESDDREGYSCIEIARIKEVSSNGLIILDDHHIPSCLTLLASSVLSNYCRELSILLQNRGDSISETMFNTINNIDTSDIVDFLLLQLINRYQPLLSHILKMQNCHPEDFYKLLTSLTSELATFTRKDHRPVALPNYQHEDLQTSFSQLINELQRSLSIVFQQKASLLSLEKTDYNIWVSPINDRQLLKETDLILAISAETSMIELQNSLPKYVKISAVEKIKNIISHALPGIPIEPLTTAPRQLPYSKGATYYQINRKNDEWNNLENSAAIAIQCGADIPGLNIELWAIRE